MALAGLKLWELVDLALPMLLCLVAQCVVMVLFSYLIVFRVMGRNYDAAVMTAGFIGFSMGATSNAMANMQVVTKKYGPSQMCIRDRSLMRRPTGWPICSWAGASGRGRRWPSC